jgi:hypothetical protein
MFDEAATRQRRRRAWMKWVGGACSVLMLIIWLGSGRWAMGKWTQTGTYISGFDGRCALGHWPREPGGLYKPAPIWFARAPKYAIVWSLLWERDQRGWVVLIPLWIPAVIAIGFPALAFFRDVRDPIREFNHCKKCNFNRAGFANNARCPECGHDPISQSPLTARTPDP